MFGGEPGMPVSCRFGPVSDGNEFIKPCVYGCSGLSNSSCAGASSTISPGVHDRDAVGELDHQREVVRDEEDREAQLLLQLLDLLHDILLHHHVERRGRLVHDHQRRLAGPGRWRSPPAGACRPKAGAGRSRAAAGRCRRHRAVPRRGRWRRVFGHLWCVISTSVIWSPIFITGLSEFIALWKTIETSRQRKASSSSSFISSTSVAVEQDVAARDDRRRVQQAHDGVGDRRFAAARLAGQPEHLARRDRERDPVHRPHRAARRHDIRRRGREIEQRSTGVAITSVLAADDRGCADAARSCGDAILRTLFKSLSARRRGLVISSIP